MIEIWVPLSVVLGVGFIGGRAGAEVGQSVSLCHSCVWEGCADLFPNQEMEQLIGTILRQSLLLEWSFHEQPN